MLTSDFDFDLPRALIAQSPAVPRDRARLLRVAPSLSDHRISDLTDLLRPGDLLVTNDTKVIPARLRGRRIAPPNPAGRGEAEVELTLHKNLGEPSAGAQSQPSEGATWQAFARPAKRLQPGDKIVFAEDLDARVENKSSGGEVTLTFSSGGAALLTKLERIGIMPLPPYIKREATGKPRDRRDYQTIFAAQPGAVAAPTAGLHFTPSLLNALEKRDVKRCPLTLHVGAGTFLPVKSDDPREHKMHTEYGVLSEEAVQTIAQTKADGGRVVAVGTTALRLLESACDQAGQLQAFQGDTDIFILPGYRFQCVDLLLTNFHLPRSTLFMLVSAFAGLGPMKAAYTHAIANGYRFYSYGDACLLSREDQV
ncbi:MAG: tRNA preQ1(34) S-adenosylmethionine ribosyltransferase-isomerase QueA [Pseudomonadota bacterium]